MNEVRPLIRTVQGLLNGVIEESISSTRYAAYRGIPYAKPPIAELRFRDPAPPESWSSVKDASKHGPNCAQYDPITGSFVGSDDCLYLNVYAPIGAVSTSLRKPVMFWIHGGGFAYGSGDDNLYGPDYLIDKGIVLVTINYRLNVLGFLNVEDEEASGNQGLKDQVLALKWVRDNIGNFGGDPNNVTIFGESAGAASVHFLALSPLAKGLFHKAISQSGVAINPWTIVQDSPKVHAQKLAEALGEKISDSKLLVRFLRSIDAQRLARADAAMASEFRRTASRYFTPSIDTKSTNPFLPANIALRAGIGVPYMIGHTSHEGIIFLTGMTDEAFSLFNNEFEKALSPAMMKVLNERGLDAMDAKRIYFGNEAVSRETRENYARFTSDVQFISGIHEIAAIQAATNKCPTYMYKFSYDNGKSLVKAQFGLDMPGVCHADDLPYVFYPKLMQRFGVPPAEKNSTEHLVIERVTQMWTNFAKTGNPTPALSNTLPVKWKALEDPGNLCCMNIGEDLQMESITNVNDYLVKQNTSKL